MLGMSFEPFLALLIVGFVSAFVLHYIVRYRMLSGFDGFLGKWVVAWVGAWLGSPVLGHWGPHAANEYIIPAFIGSFSLAFLTTLGFRASRAAAAEAFNKKEVPAPPAQLEMRKAS